MKATMTAAERRLCWLWAFQSALLAGLPEDCAALAANAAASAP